jgi:hypothetical protein
MMRNDTTISATKNQGAALRDMARIEGRPITEILAEMIEGRAARYPISYRTRVRAKLLGVGA